MKLGKFYIMYYGKVCNKSITFAIGPSKKYTKIFITIGWLWITIDNSYFGQLGPEILWKDYRFI